MEGTVSFHISVGVLACLAYKRAVNLQFLLWPCSQETIKHSMLVCSPAHQLPQVSWRIKRFWLLPKWAIFSNVWQNSGFTCVFHCHITTIYCMLHLTNFSAHCNVMQPVHYLSDWETVAGESRTGGEDGAMHWQVGLDNCSFSFHTLYLVCLWLLVKTKNDWCLPTTSLALSLNGSRTTVLTLFSQSGAVSLPFLKASFSIPSLNVLRTASTSSRSRNPDALLSHFSKSASKSSFRWAKWETWWTCNRATAGLW